MVISDTQLKKFQELYKTHFGKDISKEEAYDKGYKLVRLMSLILQPKSACTNDYGASDNDDSSLQDKRAVV